MLEQFRKYKPPCESEETSTQEQHFFPGGCGEGRARFLKRQLSCIPRAGDIHTSVSMLVEKAQELFCRGWSLIGVFGKALQSKRFKPIRHLDIGSTFPQRRDRLVQMGHDDLDRRLSIKRQFAG